MKSVRLFFWLVQATFAVLLAMHLSGWWVLALFGYGVSLSVWSMVNVEIKYQERRSRHGSGRRL